MYPFDSFLESNKKKKKDELKIKKRGEKLARSSNQ